jgi:hypothetical protein
MARTGGALFVAAGGVPREGPHKLARRDLAGSGDAAMLRLPSDGSGRFFKDAALSLNRAGVSTHLFAVGPEYADLSCVAVPGGLSAGSCQYYESFDKAAQERLHADLFERLTDAYTWETSSRMRVGLGLKLGRPFANCLISPDKTISLCAVGRTSGIAFEFAVETPIAREDVVVQLVYLFTDSERRRVLRVFTFGARVSSESRAVLASVDDGAVAALMVRKAAVAILTSGPVAAIGPFKTDVQNLLTCGARFAALYHFMHALLSHDIFHPKLGYDWLMAQMIEIRSHRIVDSLLMMYPRMLCIDAGSVVVPLTASSFGIGNCFLVHRHSCVIVWIGANAASDWLQDAFGVSSLVEVPPQVPSLGTQANTDLNAAIQECWALSGRYLPVTVIPQGDPREGIFKQILVEDSMLAGEIFSEWRNHMTRGFV